MTDSIHTTTRSFADELWTQIAPLMAAQLAHPFVRALGDGTLPAENFAFYIRQDARYLGEYAKAFALAASRASDPNEVERFGKLFLETYQVERMLHEQYAKRFGLTPAEMAATPMAPTNYAYTRHLLTVASTGTLAEILAAVLPCAWIYAEIGRHFARLGPPAETHPYRDWINAYAAPEFEEVGAWLRERLNVRAPYLSSAERARCVDAFVVSTKYEWMFWEMAHTLEQWPI